MSLDPWVDEERTNFNWKLAKSSFKQEKRSDTSPSEVVSSLATETDESYLSARGVLPLPVGMMAIMASHNIGYCFHSFFAQVRWNRPTSCGVNLINCNGEWDVVCDDTRASQEKSVDAGDHKSTSISPSINSISAPGMELLLSVSISITVTLRESSLLRLSVRVIIFHFWYS